MSKDDEGRVISSCFALKGLQRVLLMLFSRHLEGDLHNQDDQGRLPLHHACRSRRLNVSSSTAQYAAAKIQDGKISCLFTTLARASPECRQCVLLTTFPETSMNGFGYTPLAEAGPWKTKMDL
jgi:ankyrin repeat protein